jgi:hypothetical protein
MLKFYLRHFIEIFFFTPINIKQCSRGLPSRCVQNHMPHVKCPPLFSKFDQIGMILQISVKPVNIKFHEYPSVRL